MDKISQLQLLYVCVHVCMCMYAIHVKTFQLFCVYFIYTMYMVHNEGGRLGIVSRETEGTDSDSEWQY